MRRISFDPQDCDNWADPKRATWKAWLKRSRDARDEVLNALALPPAERGSIDLNQAIWKDLKEWLLTHVFAKKCAYCEANISVVSFGDGEHYRPKSRVTVMQGGKKAVVPDHPGYYWLAYDWKNLVPACTRCNNQKSDQFPTENEHVKLPAPDFEALDTAEAPLLVHPYRDEPSEFLQFGMNGVITARGNNPKGQNTIRVFGLDREDLVESRKALQEKARTHALTVFAGKLTLLALSQPNQIDLKEQMKTYIGEEAEYTAAIREYVKDKVIPDIMTQLTVALT